MPRRRTPAATTSGSGSIFSDYDHDLVRLRAILPSLSHHNALAAAQLETMAAAAQDAGAALPNAYNLHSTNAHTSSSSYPSEGMRSLEYKMTPSPPANLDHGFWSNISCFFGSSAAPLPQPLPRPEISVQKEARVEHEARSGGGTSGSSLGNTTCAYHAAEPQLVVVRDPVVSCDSLEFRGGAEQPDEDIRIGKIRQVMKDQKKEGRCLRRAGCKTGRERPSRSRRLGHYYWLRLSDAVWTAWDSIFYHSERREWKAGD